ncbi:MAG: LruC domain-containing protein [Bacteroidetes bacterium]|nr:LruC domain-containing protein [Bacteroidota bacterium]
MKTLKFFTILLIAGLLTTACNRNSDDIINPDEDPIIESVNDLVVPADFDWKTHQTIDVIVTLPQTGELKPLLITNRDGSKLYFRGFPEDGSRTLRTKITLPTYEYELRLIYSGANGPNMAFISNGQMIYDFVSSQKSVTVVGCDLSNFTTYSKGGWGQNASGNNVGALRDQYFDQVYPNDFVIGNPDNFTITFESAADVENYLPGGGEPAVLNNSWFNPLKKDKLGNMADQIIAARLNRDYNAAGFLGVNDTYFLGELVFLDGPFANTTVNDFLTMAETALGGGDMLGHTASVWSSAAESIIYSFHEGIDGNILTCPTDPEQDDPFVEVSSTCISNEVVFTISNTGDGDMTAAYDYTVTKNDVELDSGTYELDINETLELLYSGLTTDEFRIVVETPRGEDIEEIISGCGSQEPPTEQFEGTLAYEDLWPGKGDYDFNDLVIDYDFDITKNDEEIVQSITAIFVVKAFGASYHNGFGFTFPTVEPSDIVSVTGYDVVNSSVFNIAGNGLENGQSKATIIVFDDARRVMPQTTGGIGVNTQLEYDFIDPVTLVVEIVFADNAITYSELNIGTFNPFLIVNTMINGVPGERGLEIHLPNYEPSDLFDEQYLGQFEDDSSIAEDRYFVTENNLPWAINIAEPFDWVIEFQDITGAYNVFAEWAQSGGTNYPDWYQDETGYRNNSLIYPTQIGN